MKHFLVLLLPLLLTSTSKSAHGFTFSNSLHRSPSRSIKVPILPLLRGGDSPLSSSSSLHSIDILQSYNTLLTSSPLLTKSVTAGVILGAADYATQAFGEKSDSEDDKKEVRFHRYDQNETDVCWHNKNEHPARADRPSTYLPFWNVWSYPTSPVESFLLPPSRLLPPPNPQSLHLHHAY